MRTFITKNRIGLNRAILFPQFLFWLFASILLLTVDFPEYDESIYLNIIRSIRQTGGAWRPIGEFGFLHTDHTTLYQHSLTIWSFLFAENLILMRLPTAVAGSISIWLVYDIVARKTTTAAALVASSLLAVSPFFILYSTFIREEIFVGLFNLLALRVLVIQPIWSRRTWLTVGLFIALAVMCKELSLSFAGFLVLFAFLATKNDWRERLVSATLTAVPTMIGFAIWLGWMFALDPFAFERTINRWWFSVVGGTADGRAQLSWYSWGQVLSSTFFGPILLLFLVVALVYWVWRGEKKDATLYLIGGYILLAVSLTFLISLKEPRHIITVLPLAAVFIGLVLPFSSISAWGQQSFSSSAIVGLISFILLWGMSPFQLPQPVDEWRTNPRIWWQEPIRHRLFINDAHFGLLYEAAVVAQSNIPQGEVMLVTNEGPFFGYYAERNYIFLYTQSADTIYALLDSHDYLILDNLNFSALSDEEKTAVLHTIETDFEQYDDITDGHRHILLYKKR